MGPAVRVPRPVHPHHLAGAPGRRAGTDRADLRAQSRRFLRTRPTRDSIASAARHSSSRRRSWTGSASFIPTRTLEMVSERNWFFRLSRYQDFLRRLIETNPDFIRPESRRNEIIGLLDQGLEDVSASRARLGWGVPFPRPTSDGQQQTTYVWFDALPNYWTATRLPGRRRQLAGAAARRRQGHHPIPLRHLAGDARGGRSPIAGRRLGARLRAARR